MIIFIQQQKQYQTNVLNHFFLLKYYSTFFFCLALPPPTIIIEDYSREKDMNKSLDVSHSSQLTNDLNDTQPLISSTTNEKIITPARISYRTNPDGSRVSISRPPLPINHQSPLISLRRVRNQYFFFVIFLLFFYFYRHQLM